MAQVRKDNDPLLQFLKVPYICNYNVPPDKNPFEEVSDRHGPRLKTAQDCSSAGLSPDQAAIFLQEWLFFAVLHSICNLVEVEFNTSDFISSCPETGKLVVTGSRFRKYVWLWTGGVAVGTSSSLGRLHEQSHAVISMLQTFNNVVDSWEDCQQDRITSSTNLNLVLLSIVQLGAHLKPIVEKVFHVNFENIPFLTSYPKYGRELLLQAGWCVGELPSLLSRYRPVDLLYLSTLDRHRDGTSHSQCSEDGCRANWLYGKHYKMSHTLICHGSLSCEMVKVPITKVCAILAAGNIPVLRLSSKTSSTAPSLQIEEFALSGHDQKADGTSTIRYVGISHVWSDGMGNPSVNGLYACQLHRIQQAVNGLYSTERDTPTENVPFWCDTLLIPRSWHFRSLAISQMARTYLHADKVLVLDSWLTRSSFSLEGPKHLLLKVLHSDWNTRLWTYHEMVLAKECYFQFADSTFTIFELQHAVENLEIEPLEELQAILSGFKEDHLLNTKSTLSLLRALIHLEPRSMDHNVKKWAALPPEKDPRWDLDRMTAVYNEARNNLCCKILEKWFPILAEADCLSPDPEEDAWRLKDLVLHIPCHPVKIEPSSTAEGQFMSGYVHGIDRTLDLARDKASVSRQILGVASTPSKRLAPMVAGSRGRTTSWKEDETICLGGIIGLDVSTLAQVRVADPENRPEEQVAQVCEARMKIFLRAVREFSESILFWPSAGRLPTYPWRWAPASFLDKDGDLRLWTSYNGECTNEGFIFEFDSVRLSPVLNQKNDHLILQPDEKEFYFRQRTPRKKYNVPVEVESAHTSIPDADTNSPFIDVFYRANIRTLFPGTECSSWHTFFTQPANDLYLLKRFQAQSKRRVDAVLVRLLETKGDTRLGYCLATVQCLQMLKARPESFIDSELEPEKVKWCVG
jgi:hypothetical protein